MSTLRFDERVAVITGAGRGLGREYALLLASKGAKVVVNDLGGGLAGGDEGSAGPAEQVAQEIRAAGGEAVSNSDSVTDLDAVYGMVEQVGAAGGDDAQMADGAVAEVEAHQRLAGELHHAGGLRIAHRGLDGAAQLGLESGLDRGHIRRWGSRGLRRCGRRMTRIRARPFA